MNYQLNKKYSAFPLAQEILVSLMGLFVIRNIWDLVGACSLVRWGKDEFLSRVQHVYTMVLPSDNH